MLLDLPPFFINPLDDQVLKSGRLVCYTDKARLNVDFFYLIKNGWLRSYANEVLPAGYYSLFDQNNLRLMDFENYCQTGQGEIIEGIELAKRRIVAAKEKILEPEESRASERINYTGEITGLMDVVNYLLSGQNQIFGDRLIFTELRNQGKNTRNPLDNGWNFDFGIEGFSYSYSWVDANLAFGFSKNGKEGEIGSIEAKRGSEDIYIRLYFKEGISSITKERESIVLSNLYYAYRGQSVPQQPRDSLKLKISNAQANVPWGMPSSGFDSFAKMALINEHYSRKNYSAGTLARQANNPIPATFGNRHKFYRASDGRVFWGGADITVRMG
ncbi:MAG: hypothetical protein LBC75_02650 [Fibromonadaceae bacterium]|jgi:hypothetical protein|nr:hypothetical protein [Fibromonadaceae bacterium]